MLAQQVQIHGHMPDRHIFRREHVAHKARQSTESMILVAVDTGLGSVVDRHAVNGQVLHRHVISVAVDGAHGLVGSRLAAFCMVDRAIVSIECDAADNVTGARRIGIAEIQINAQCVACCLRGVILHDLSQKIVGIIEQLCAIAISFGFPLDTDLDDGSLFCGHLG